MDIVALIARILFVVVFLMSGIGHLRATKPMAGYAKHKGVPLPTVSTVVSGVLMILGAVSVVLGIFGDLGALLLFASVAAIPFLMHRFWSETDATAKQTEQVQFNKTLSLAGGALAVFVLFALVPGLGFTVTGPLFG